MDVQESLVLYGIFVTFIGVLLGTAAQMVESSSENRRRLFVSLAALLINVLVAPWVFFHISGKKAVIPKLIFRNTKILSLYVGFSLLEPAWFKWPGLVAISVFFTIITIFHDLIFRYYRKYVLAERSLVVKLGVVLTKVRQIRSTNGAHVV